MCMVDRKIGNLSIEFSLAMNNLEVKVGTKLHEEREDRYLEAKITNGRIDEFMERLQRLGANEVQAVEPGGAIQQGAESAWRPAHDPRPQPLHPSRGHAAPQQRFLAQVWALGGVLLGGRCPARVWSDKQGARAASRPAP